MQMLLDTGPPPAAFAEGGTKVDGRTTPHTENSPSGSLHQASPADRNARLPVLAIVRRARVLLMDAQYRLGDLGLSSPALNDLSAEAGALVSAWEGRGRPVADDLLPPGFEKAACEYRRRRGLSY